MPSIERDDDDDEGEVCKGISPSFSLSLYPFSMYPSSCSRNIQLISPFVNIRFIRQIFSVKSCQIVFVFSAIWVDLIDRMISIFDMTRPSPPLNYPTEKIADNIQLSLSLHQIYHTSSFSSSPLSVAEDVIKFIMYIYISSLFSSL